MQFEIDPKSNPVRPERFPLDRPVVPENDRGRDPGRDPVRDIFERPRIRINDFAPSLGEPRAGFRRGPHPKGRGYKLVLFAFMASLIDILLSTAACCLGIALAATLLQTSFSILLAFFNGSVLHLAVAAFVSIIFTYKMLFRAFLGYTLGEWTCGLRMGDLQARRSEKYVLRVILRSAVVLLTGIIVLPALSLLFGRDFAGKISGVYLYQLP